MQKNLILSIQDQLKELTDKKFSKAYIVKFITPIIEYIVFSKQKNASGNLIAQTKEEFSEVVIKSLIDESAFSICDFVFCNL